MDTNQSSDKISQPILLTAAKEDMEGFGEDFLSGEVKTLHTPLERYTMRIDDSDVSEALSKLDTFENIVYGSKRNAWFFLKQIKHHDKLDRTRNQLNLAFDEATFELLEEDGIAAVYPQGSDKAIDLVELMLRLKRFGPTLYPCGTHKREEFPGLLEELDIPVTELDVFDLEGPLEDNLAVYRKKVKAQPPKVIIFHSGRSVNRTLAAFPDLDYENARIISADTGVSEKLKEKGVDVNAQAKGSWESILELI